MSLGLKLPHRLGPPLFAALTSGIMSLIVSGVATWKALGLPPDFARHLLLAWANAWPIAFVTLLFVAPLVRSITSLLVAPPPVHTEQSGSKGA